MGVCGLAEKSTGNSSFEGHRYYQVFTMNAVKMYCKNMVIETKKNFKEDRYCLDTPLIVMGPNLDWKTVLSGSTLLVKKKKKWKS